MATLGDIVTEYQKKKTLGSIVEEIKGTGETQIKTALPKWVDPLGTALEMTGLIGGGALGLSAGPWGAIPGAGLGYSGMKGLYEKTLELMGIYKPMGIKETAIRRGEDILIGGGMEAGGQIGGKIIPFVAEKVISKLPGIAKATTPEMQGIIDLAKREKISILAPDVTGNRTQALIFNAADKSIGGSGVTQRAAGKVVQNMDAYGNRILSELGGQFEPTVVGQVAKEGMAVKFNPIEDFGNKLYDNFIKEASGVSVNLSNTSKIVEEIRNSKEFIYLPGQIKSVLNRVFSDLSPKTKVMAGTRYGGMPIDILEKLQEQGITKTMTIEELESIRRAISKLSFNKEISGDVGNRISVKVLGSIDEDMALASIKSGSLAKEALDDARKFQRENIFGIFKGKTELGKPSIGTRIQTVQNEDFLKIISKGNITELQDMKKVLPDETMQFVKRSWLTDLFSKHQRLLQTPEGKQYMIDTPGVAAELNKFGDKYLKILFNEKELTMINNFRELSKHIGFAEKIAGNPSGTAQTIYTIQLITGGAFGGIGLAKGDPIMTIGGLIFTFGSPWMIAKFMTSDAGFRYMTTGFKGSPVIKEIISNSIKAAAIGGTHANIDINEKEIKQ